MSIRTFALFLLFAHNSYGQTYHYQKLIDTALTAAGALFVSKKPIKTIRLQQAELDTYFHSYADYADKVLDTVMFAEIVRNSKTPDTTLWQETELNNYILVNSKDESISKKRVLEKLALTDRKQKKFYSKQINRYNAAEPYYRNLFYFSRPVFD